MKTYPLPVIQLMIEAIRRIKMADRHEKSKPILERWVGLGTEAAYRPAIKAGLMKFVRQFSLDPVPPPRCMGWLHLTPKGLKVLRQIKKGNKPWVDHVCNDSQRLDNQFMLAGGYVKT